MSDIATPSTLRREERAVPLKNPVRRTGRLEFLDAVRGFAALAVVISHALERTPHSWSLPVNLGEFGVVTFFIVSGFIIPVSMERAGALKPFWVSRIFRLYPMYWVSLIFVLLLAWMHLSPLPPGFAVHQTRAVLLNVTMLQQFVNIPNALDSYWTLTLELLFYFLCSFLFLRSWLSNSLVSAWASISVMAVSVLVAGIAFHRSLPAGWIGLLITAFWGTVLYRVYSGALKAKVLYPLIPALALTLYVGFWFRFYLYPREYVLHLTTVCSSWALAYAVFAMFFLMRNRTFPEWTLWLGRISYSLYLMHWIPLLLIPATWNPILYLSLCLPLALGSATLTYNFVEKPAIAICRTRILPMVGGKKVPLPSA